MLTKQLELDSNTWNDLTVQTNELWHIHKWYDYQSICL